MLVRATHSNMSLEMIFLPYKLSPSLENRQPLHRKEAFVSMANLILIDKCYSIDV